MQEIFSAMFDGKLRVLEQIGFEITDKKMGSYFLYKIQDKFEVVIRILKTAEAEVDIYFTPQDVEKLKDFVKVQGSELDSRVHLCLTYCKVQPKVRNGQYFLFCPKEREGCCLGMVTSSLTNWFFEHDKCMDIMLKAKINAEEGKESDYSEAEEEIKIKEELIDVMEVI